MFLMGTAALQYIVRAMVALQGSARGHYTFCIHYIHTLPNSHVHFAFFRNELLNYSILTVLYAKKWTWENGFFKST